MNHTKFLMVNIGIQYHTIYITPPYLWWVIALMNNISNPFEELEAGDELNVLRDEYVYQLTSDLEKIAED
jgi:hypothetical protein